MAGAAPVHFGPMFYGSQISPDGKWVAFGTLMGKGFLGVIVSADGATLRFFAPDDERREELREAIRDGGDDAWPAPADCIKRAHAVLNRVAREHQTPIFQEALAFSRAGVYLAVLVGTEADEIKALLPEARKHQNAFLDAYPDHALGQKLKKKLDRLLAKQRSRPSTEDEDEDDEDGC
ncbi:MAG: hypothetical protein QGI33_01915 [Candidatus Brocadiia bacterium]|nr:hypothetical protein [Candidatus Brocadiia bacterium]